MKVTVFRPKLAQGGLGLPKAFLGEDHPTEGDWIQSAKHDYQPDSYRPLHMMGREFLIYSMYRPRQPRFLGYALENFGAAVKRLGFALPLTEENATWLSAPPAGLDPAQPHEYQFMLNQIAHVFGNDVAKAQAKELSLDWLPLPVTPEQLAERMKAEIIEDVKNGVVPLTVKNFSELHNYVDANCYGGTEALLDEMDKHVPDTDEGHSSALSALCDICNPAQEIINDWIAAGGIREAAKGWADRAKWKPDNGHRR